MKPDIRLGELISAVKLGVQFFKYHREQEPNLRFAKGRRSALTPDQHRAWAPCTRWRTPSTSHIP